MSGEFPDPDIQQDPGVPGAGDDAPTPDEQDEQDEQDERLDDSDNEGHLTPPR